MIAIPVTICDFDLQPCVLQFLVCMCAVCMRHRLHIIDRCARLHTYYYKGHSPNDSITKYLWVQLRVVLAPPFPSLFYAEKAPIRNVHACMWGYVGLACRRALELKPSSPSYALNLMHGLELEQDYTQALHLALNFCATTKYVVPCTPSSFTQQHAM